MSPRLSLLVLTALSSAFFATAQLEVPGYCCPKTVSSRGGTYNVNRLAALGENTGDLGCAYQTPRGEFCKFDGWCSYATEDRKEVVSQRPYKAGALTDYRCAGCSQAVSNIRDGNVPCSSTVCCPSSVGGYGFGALKEASFNGGEKFWCAYQGGSGCEYNIKSGKLTFTYYRGPCPPTASTDGTCIINGQP